MASIRLFAIMVASFSMGCVPGREYYIENNTSSIIEIYNSTNTRVLILYPKHKIRANHPNEAESIFVSNGEKWVYKNVKTPKGFDLSEVLEIAADQLAPFGVSWIIENDGTLKIKKPKPNGQYELPEVQPEGYPIQPTYL